MRDDSWLRNRMLEIWQLRFMDVPMLNEVKIRFKGKWKLKFGHIRMKNKITEIIVNSLFKHEDVPQYIVDLTIAHELIHYSHGFQSPLERKFNYPHQGGIVRKELKKRGFKDAMELERKIFRKEWPEMFKRIKIE
ncbi:MAG: hypothetical protein AABW45_00765 [Nanoarchaeota archaeon]